MMANYVLEWHTVINSKSGQSGNGRNKFVVVRTFNATRHPRHIEAAVIIMYMYLYSLVFMDHPCTLVTKRCPVHVILNPGYVEYMLGLLMV